MKKLLFCGLAALCLYGQTASADFAISELPPGRGATTLYKYTSIGGSDYVEYICTASAATSKAATISITQIVDSSSTATVTTSENHGLAVNNTVTISGVTGDTDLNGTYVILTVPSATTFTVTSADVTDATYNNAGISLTTWAPRSTSAIWAIKRYTYGGTSGTKVVAEQWAVKSGQNQSSSPSPQHICDNRASLSYQ